MNVRTLTHYFIFIIYTWTRYCILAHAVDQSDIILVHVFDPSNVFYCVLLSQVIFYRGFYWTDYYFY